MVCYKAVPVDDMYVVVLIGTFNEKSVDRALNAFRNLNVYEIDLTISTISSSIELGGVVLLNA